MKLADAELAIRARAGDRWAHEAIFRRYVGPIGNLVLRMMRNRSDAEDVVQDTFAIALDKLHRLQDPASLRSWLFSIAVHGVHRRLRRRRLLSALGFGADVDAGFEELADPRLTQEERAELALLDRALAPCPAAERIAWMLRNVEGESLADVAAICGCSLATAKRRIRAAADVVREHVEGGGR